MAPSQFVPTVGAAVFAPHPTRGWVRSTVVFVQDPPRRLTGGRGVGVEYDDGTHGSGWDAEDLYPAGLVADGPRSPDVPMVVGGAKVTAVSLGRWDNNSRETWRVPYLGTVHLVGAYSARKVRAAFKADAR